MIHTGDQYTHYKRGGTYEIVDLATLQSNTVNDGKQVVIYRQLHDTPTYPKGALWVRPLDMFLEEVELDGTMVPRFKKI